MSNMEHTGQVNFLTGWSPFLLLILLGIAGCYLYITGQGGKKWGGTYPVNRLKKISFLSGVFLFFVAKGTPLNQLGHSLFLIHMAQQSIIYLAVPPLILAGLPSRLVSSMLKTGLLRKGLTLFTKPLIAIFLFNVLFSFYHIPFIFDVIMSNMLWMNLSIIILLPLAFLMWWPVLSPIHDLNELKPLHKIAYIFGMGVLLTPACALIIFSKEILYQTYIDLPRLYGVSLLDDQQSGGIVMKVMQEVIYGFVLTKIFFQWVRDEKIKNKEEDKIRLERIKGIQKL